MPDVVIYTRQLCGFCTRAKRVLSHHNVDFTEHDATFDPQVKRDMIQRSGRTTFPQIFIGAEHIGGCDDLLALDRSGALAAMLES